MGKLSSDSWFGRVGRSRKKKSMEATIGVLSFEVSSLMSKTVHLWYSLSDEQILRLRDEVLHLEGVRKLVSSDDDFLLGLALAEITDSLGFLARSVARLGKRCSDQILQKLEHVVEDLIKNDADLHGFVYRGNKMERKVKKMERFVNSSSNLYQELEVLTELEQSFRRMQLQANSDPNRRNCLTDFKHKVYWQRQEVKSLRENSLWNRSYDYTVRLLARSLFTIVARIKHVFGFHLKELADDVSLNDSRSGGGNQLSRSYSVNGLMHSAVHPSDPGGGGLTRFASGPLRMSGMRSGPISVRDRGQCLRSPQNVKRIKWPVSARPFSGCIVGGDDSPVLQSCMPIDNGFGRRSNVVRRIVEDDDSEVHVQENIFNHANLCLSLSESRRKLLNAPPSTLGAAALALHYANIIIVVEKLVASPHLISPDARDDLYNMLTTSIRAALRARLKTYAKNLYSSIYDPILAGEWSEALTKILDWLAPLAHNMIKWQSERNFEQHLVSSTNVLLLQTLYFANQAKTEAAITELLVGLNYLWRFGKELNTKAMLECTVSGHLDDCSEV